MSLVKTITFFIMKVRDIIQTKIFNNQYFSEIFGVLKSWEFRLVISVVSKAKQPCQQVLPQPNSKKSRNVTEPIPPSPHRKPTGKCINIWDFIHPSSRIWNTKYKVCLYQISCSAMHFSIHIASKNKNTRNENAYGTKLPCPEGPK